jgi:hypothetical protein
MGREQPAQPLDLALLERRCELDSKRLVASQRAAILRHHRQFSTRLLSQLASHCPNEALHLGLVVVVVHAGADERVQSARGQIERGRARRAGHVNVDVHGGQPVARLARRFAVLEKADDPALLHAEIVHADAGSLREFLPQQRSNPFDPRFDRVDAHRIA